MNIPARKSYAAALALAAVAFACGLAGVLGAAAKAPPTPPAKQPTAPAATTPDLTDAQFKSFVSTYCIECHGPQKQKGDRRFDKMKMDASNADTLTDLQDIVEALNVGEMPPKKAKQPSDREKLAVIASLTKVVGTAQDKASSTNGQTILRRLNRREYINTIGDLFSMNMAMFDPTRKFPRDQTVEHMDNIGETLQTSGYLLEQYLDAAEQVVDKAFSAKDRSKEKTWTFNGNFHQQPELEYSHGHVFNFKYMNLYESRNSESHEGAYGAITGFTAGVPADGYYEIKVQCESLNRHNPYDPKLFGMDPADPFRLGIVAGNEKVGALHHSQPTEPELAPQVTVGDNGPEWKTFKVWLDAGYTPRFIFPNGMIDARKAWTQIISKYRNLLPANARNSQGIVEARANVLRYGKMPQIRIHEIQIRGPLSDTWPPAPQKAVLGDKPFDPSRTRQILESFASRAYRRPVRSDEVDRLMSVVDARTKAGAKPLDALKDGVKTVLCSPAFLYLAEPQPDAQPAWPGAGGSNTGKLTAYELASRLSYFLWSSMPDGELMHLAQTGDLLRPDILTAQTRRLLTSPRSDAFVDGFLDSWLNLRSLGDMPPDRSDFRMYYAQDLQNAMLRETQLFTRDLITQNASVVRFIDSDYTFLNNSLARLYGMPEAVSPTDSGTFRRVKFTKPNRGGLLGQGSVLTVSANGVETSPVIRGVWLLENILGTPTPPPPDNVPPIDPDVRGAKTMRDILTKHRSNATCMECHQKIDPLGFALENFDPIGTYRTNYEGGAKIDTSGELPDGKTFKDIAGLKKILLDRKDQFARTLTERLLSYACGRRVESSDRPKVSHIVGEVKKGSYGFRTMIEQVVASDAFRSN